MPNCQAKASEFLRARGMSRGHRTIHYARNDYWVWRGGSYHTISETHLDNEILEWLRGPDDTEFSMQQFIWVCRCVKATLTTNAPRRVGCWLHPQNLAERLHRWVAFQNGILDLTALCGGISSFVPTSPRWFSEVMLPYAYDKNAVCPLWESCLSSWMNEDSERIRVLQQFFGYCLVPPTGKYATALFLEGEGANGKSVFCKVVEGVLGASNTCGVPLAEFGDKFALSPTAGKLVNFANETDGRKQMPLQKMKAYIDGDRMDLPVKFKQDPISCHPTARLIICWNRRPPISDDSDGFWRRVLLVPWNKQFMGSTRDPFLGEKLEKELPGILNWAITGYKDLQKHKKFAESATVASAKAEYRRENGSAGEFLKEYVGFGSGELLLGTIYDRYTEWCGEHLVDGDPRKTFNKEIKRIFKIHPGRKRVGDRSANNRDYYYSGLVWKPQETTDVRNTN